jgi:hypothetical protein
VAAVGGFFCSLRPASPKRWRAEGVCCRQMPIPARHHTFDGYLEQLASLSAFLQEHRCMIEQRAFVSEQLDWERDLPRLSASLRALDADQIAQAERDPFAACLPPSLIALQKRADALCAMRDLAPDGAAKRDELLGRHQHASFRINERKRNQINAFYRATCDPLWRSEHEGIVDWCAGKGHLGRQFAAHAPRQTRVSCLERQPSLCEAGKNALGACSRAALRAHRVRRLRA